MAHLQQTLDSPAFTARAVMLIVPKEPHRNLPNTAMKTCHICHQSWTAHAPNCRVHADMERLRRVHERMVADGRDDPLRDKMATYINLFGNLPCQKQPELPTTRDCEKCGHKAVCVILPRAA